MMNPQRSPPGPALADRGIVHLLGMAGCGAWAFGLCYSSGLRGFFAMDQSIVFDGGWRILSGQIPFVDFFLPHGPLSMWIQSLAFGVLGVSYRVYVLTAAAMNVAGAWLAYGTLRILAPEKQWPAWVAGMLTGTWLYSPMGTTYIEQTGFVFLWAGVFAVVQGLCKEGWCRLSWMVLAGLALAAAILAKTNTGILAAPSLFLMPMVMRERPATETFSDWLGMGAGLMLGLGLFYLWLACASDPAAFHRHVIEIAGREGRKRILENKELHFIVCSLVNGKGNDLIRLLTVSAYTLMGLGIALVLRAGKGLVGARRIRQLGWLGLLWVAFQQVFGVTSNNNGINEQPFLGLIFVCACLVVSEIAASVSPQRLVVESFSFFQKTAALLLVGAGVFTIFFYVKGIRGMGNYDFGLGVLLALGIFFAASSPAGSRMGQGRILRWVGSAILGILFLIGFWGSYFRQAQDFFNFNTRYVVHDDIPMLKGLAWAEGVNEDAREMHPTWPDLVRIWALLKETPGRFYLLGNHTFLYALTDKPSVGPLSWFFKGLTYSAQYNPAFDRRFAEEVDQPDMVFFVTEEDFGLPRKLQDFPRLHEVLRSRYQPFEKIGIFRIYRRTSFAQASGPSENPANSRSPAPSGSGPGHGTF